MLSKVRVSGFDQKTGSDCHQFQSSGRTFTCWTLKARLSVRLFKPGEAFGFEVFHEKLHQKTNLMEHSIVIWWVDGCCHVSFCQKPRLGISTLVVTMRNQVMTPWLVTGTYSNLFTGSVFSTNSPCTSTKLSSCRQPMVFYVDIKENGNLWQQLQKTGKPKKNRHQKMATKNRKAQKPRLLCAPAFSFVDPSLLFDVCCGLSQKFLATPKQITIIFSNHVLVGSCFLSYLWRHKKWSWWNRSVIYRSLKSPHLQSLCYIKTGMKLHISSNSWPPAPKTWTWQH